MSRLTIGLDFDETFTADPKLWTAFVQSARAHSHRVIMVTARRETMDNVQIVNDFLDLWKCQMEIVFTNLGSKLEAVKHRGMRIDIWIDDNPTALVHGH